MSSFPLVDNPLVAFRDEISCYIYGPPSDCDYRMLLSVDDCKYGNTSQGVTTTRTGTLNKPVILESFVELFTNT